MSEATITIAVLSSATIHSTVVIAPIAATRRYSANSTIATTISERPWISTQDMSGIR